MNFTGLPDNFTWGVATSAFQIEGATKEAGRGTSIWDTFCNTKDKVHDGARADITCDHYHRYKEDIALMKQLGINAYRFSIAWPRIFPQGTGKPNQAGLDFYHRLLDELHRNQITPAITLYHWDLPQNLEDRGGWRSRETAQAFLTYARECFKAFGDRVDMWVTFNEPFCSTYMGHYLGYHAPGFVHDIQAVCNTIHHINLAHGLAVREYRELGGKGKIGITQLLTRFRPATKDKNNVLAAETATDLNCRIFLDPLFGRGYPKDFLHGTPESTFPVQPGDLEIIAQKIDFLGVNYYSEPAAAFDETGLHEYKYAKTYHKKTEMGWDIIPAGLYRLLSWIDNNYHHPEMYITENGCALPDRLNHDGTRCHDPERINYLREHFRMCKKAVTDGIKLKGYFLWSLMDNFEWAYGYSKRFGIVYTDYKTLKRIPKDSYYFYREVISGHEPLE